MTKKYRSRFLPSTPNIFVSVLNKRQGSQLLDLYPERGMLLLEMARSYIYPNTNVNIIIQDTQRQMRDSINNSIYDEIPEHSDLERQGKRTLIQQKIL